MELLIFVIVLGVPALLAGSLLFAAFKPETQTRVRRALSELTRSLPGRLVLMAFTGGALLVPLMMVEDLRQERGWRGRRMPPRRRRGSAPCVRGCWPSRERSQRGRAAGACCR